MHNAVLLAACTMVWPPCDMFRQSTHRQGLQETRLAGLTWAHHVWQGDEGVHCHHHAAVRLLLHTRLVQQEGLQDNVGGNRNRKLAREPHANGSALACHARRVALSLHSSSKFAHIRLAKPAFMLVLQTFVK